MEVRLRATRATHRFTDMIRKIRFWPVRGLVGLVSVAVCWLLNWMLPGVRTAYLFFPLWLGYVLVVDAVVWTRADSSIWSRSRKDLVLLFCFSAPVWWLFELFNLRTANWEYLGRDLFRPLQYNLLCTIAFSIVVPAVFETAELIQTFAWTKSFRSGPRVPATPPVFVALFIAGLGMLILVMAWPTIFYPFTWTSLVLIFEPVNYWMGRPHFLQQLRDGDWRTVVSASTRRTGMRFLLGNVELLLVPEMDLSHLRRGIPVNFRNASAGLWRLHPVRAGTVYLEGLFLAQGTTACAGWLTSPIPSTIRIHPCALSRAGEGLPRVS